MSTAESWNDEGSAGDGEDADGDGEVGGRVERDEVVGSRGASLREAWVDDDEGKPDDEAEPAGAKRYFFVTARSGPVQRAVLASRETLI